MDREAWQATVHGVTKSRTQLSDSAYLPTYYVLALFLHTVCSQASRFILIY